MFSSVSGSPVRAAISRDRGAAAISDKISEIYFAGAPLDFAVSSSLGRYFISSSRLFLSLSLPLSGLAARGARKSLLIRERVLPLIKRQI